MKERCLNSSHADYPNYGGRGIKVCDSWIDFATFLKDMGPRPLKHSLERREVNGNYEPSNCFWADQIQQGRNKRTVWMVQIDDIWEPVVEVAERLGVSPKTIRYRYRKTDKLKQRKDLANQVSSP